MEEQTFIQSLNNWFWTLSGNGLIVGVLVSVQTSIIWWITHKSHKRKCPHCNLRYDDKH